MRSHGRPLTAATKARGLQGGEKSGGDFHDAGAEPCDREHVVVHRVWISADAGIWAKGLLQIDVAGGADGVDLGGGASESGHDGETDGEVAGAVGLLIVPFQFPVWRPAGIWPDTESRFVGSGGETFVNDAVGAVEIDAGFDAVGIDGEGAEAGFLVVGQDWDVERVGETLGEAWALPVECWSAWSAFPEGVLEPLGNDMANRLSLFRGKS